jgi:hypothetical protein
VKEILNKTLGIFLIAAAWIDFSTSEVHDFKGHLLRRPFLEELLPQLFEGSADVETAGGANSFLRTR